MNTKKSVSPFNLNSISLSLVVICLLQGLYFASDIYFFKYLVFTSEIVLFVFLCYYLCSDFIFNQKFRIHYLVAVLAMIVLLVIAIWILTWEKFYFSDFMKISIYFLILRISYQITTNHPPLKIGYINWLLIIPMVFYLLDLILNYNGHAGIFINRSVASYHILVSSIILLLFKKKKVILFLYLLVLIPLAKLGAVVWLVLAVIIYNIKSILRPKIFFSILALVGFSLLFYSILGSKFYLFERLDYALEKMYFLASNISFDQLASMSWDELIGKIIQPGDSNDKFSFLFRIFHWMEISTLYWKAPISAKLFGYGFRSIPEVTYFGIVAHNDYLGLLFEAGLLFFIFFVASQIVFLYQIRSHKTFILFLAISLFFISENLYYNFLSTGLYYMLMGYVWAIVKLKSTT